MPPPRILSAKNSQKPKSKATLSPTNNSKQKYLEFYEEPLDEVHIEMGSEGGSHHFNDKIANQAIFSDPDYFISGFNTDSRPTIRSAPGEKNIKHFEFPVEDRFSLQMSA